VNDNHEVEAIIDKHGAKRDSLISMLQDIQTVYHYLPQEALETVASRVGLPMIQVYGVATFFRSFTLTPRGRHIIKVCLGTACHVRGAARVLDRMELTLGVKRESTTDDQRFTLETVNCVGCCALGPMVIIDDDYHGQVSSDKVGSLLANYE